jgi:hypothetical protein
MQVTETPRRSRRAMAWRALAMLASLGFVSVLVMTSSRAAFVDTTNNTSNQFQAGTVQLTDDDGGVTRLFNLTNMAPTVMRENCIRVDYTGSLASNVRLYGASTGSLGQYLDVTIDVGTGGSFDDCTGFTSGSNLYTGTLSDFAATRTSFTNGLQGWNGATNPSNRTYRIRVTLQDDNAAQGLSATADFTWEAQNT